MPYPQLGGVMDAKYSSVYAPNAGAISSMLNIKEAFVKYVASFPIG
jgi:hypothetical protein